MAVWRHRIPDILRDYVARQEISRCFGAFSHQYGEVVPRDLAPQTSLTIPSYDPAVDSGNAVRAVTTKVGRHLVQLLLSDFETERTDPATSRADPPEFTGAISAPTHPEEPTLDASGVGSDIESRRAVSTDEAKASQLLTPQKLHSRAEVLSSPSPVPAEPGVYAWYFDEIPPCVPTTNCIEGPEATRLLYVGISPKAPPKDGSPPSEQNLRKRITYHYRGNAEGSTLRLTLGCLLQDILGIQLRRVGSGNRRTFAEGEDILSEWMSRHAFVVWVTHQRPWQLEERLIERVDLPLNLAGNKRHPFQPKLSAIRSTAKRQADSLPVLKD